MSCATYRDASMEAALGAPASPELEKHLATCAACREALERDRALLARMDGEVADTLSARPSPELLFRIGQRVSRAADSRTWIPRWLLAAAAVCGIGIVSMQLFRRGEPRPPGAAPIATETESPGASPGVPAMEPARPPRAQPSAPPVPEAVSPRRAAPIAKAAVAERRAESEVLVPRGQETLLRQLVEATRQQRMDSASVLQAPAPSEAPKPLDVAPLEMSSIGVLPISIRRIEEFE
jgi:hypothetical protein